MSDPNPDTAASAATPAAPAAASHYEPPRRHPALSVTIVILALIAILLVLYLWGLPPFGGGNQTTDNAYVHGRTTVIAPQVSGYVAEVLVHDYQSVEAGAVLVRIDDSSYKAKLQLAQANLDAQLASLSNNTQSHAARQAALQAQLAALSGTRAQLQKAKADRKRADDLASDGSISAREHDQTLAADAEAVASVQQAEAAVEIARQDIRTVDVAREGLEAQVAAARAQLVLAQIDMDHTVIRAPEAGQLGEVGVRVGQYVTNGTQLVALVPPQRWVIANFKESQTAHIAVGQSARLSVDALDGETISGHVELLSPATGSEFAVLKPDNATGNFVKVPQRIGVRIAIDANDPLMARLRPGMSVVVTVNTHGGQP